MSSEFWPKVASRAVPTFSLFLRLGFLLFGVAILTGLFPLPGDPKNRMLFGVLCVVYGVFGLLRTTVLRRTPRNS